MTATRSAAGAGRWLALMLIAAAGAVFGGCASGGTGAGPRAAEAQIRERIASIREAILAKRAEGIVHWGTADWSFAPADGKTYDRAAYLQRADGLFARIVAIESLETVVDRVAVHDEVAEVEITQTMVRRERPADRPVDGKVTRVWLHYREHQMWVRAAAGDWRVRRVEFMAPAERRELGE